MQSESCGQDPLEKLTNFARLILMLSFLVGFRHRAVTVRVWPEDSAVSSSVQGSARETRRKKGEQEKKCAEG